MGSSLRHPGRIDQGGIISDSNEFDRDSDLTQGENPGAQGDIGAGQGNPGDDPVVTDPDPLIEGDDQPRREEHLDDEAAAI